MVFSSSVFLFAFLPLTLLVYFLIPAGFVMARNTALLIASLIFYGWGEPKYIIVMLVSIIANYVLALLIDKYNTAGKRSMAKAMLVVDVAVNLGLLGFFKYTDFLIDTVNGITGADFDLLEIALPIGISFYTFQAMSYVIDVYRGKVEGQKNFIVLAAYITLFPQLIAGPIVRYSDVEKQMKKRTSDKERISVGIRRFIIGLSKKILIANQMAVIWDEIYAMVAQGDDPGAALCWIGAVAFTFQIYFDFSGYSDMAIGLGRMFGFRFNENFNHPYISKSITEFWRRWHISLSTWFREYLYFPLGGNRVSVARHIFNLFIVWALTGLWHGANWTFVFWGLYYCVLLILEKYVYGKAIDKAPALIGHIYTMLAVGIGWVFFMSDTIGDALVYLKTCFFAGGYPILNTNTIFFLRTSLVLMVIAIICSTELPSKAVKRLREKIPAAWLFVITATLILSTAYLLYSSYNPFLYFRF